MAGRAESCVRRLAGHLGNPKAEILDLGCGSGAAGAVLNGMGFGNVDGMESSLDLLGMARSRGAYRMLFHADPLVPVDLPDRSYDAIVAPDIFTRAGAGPEVLGECVRLLRAGGLISLAAPEEAGPLLDRLAGSGELLQMDRTWDRLSENPESHGWFLVCGRL